VVSRRARCVALLAIVLCACSAERSSRRVADCVPSEQERATSHPQSAALDAVLRDAVSGGLPGALMLVREGDAVFYGAAGVPDLDEPGRPFEVCHLMPIKSITKTFVAVRVLQLVEAGVLALDASLSSLLPASSLDGLPNTDRIQVRHLLNHTSGIRHYPEVTSYVTAFLNEPDVAQPISAALDAVRGLDPYFEPGAEHRYSNTDSLLQQLIIEQLTGESLEQQLRAHIWQPLGMDDTHLHQDQPLSDHVPSGYMDIYGNGDAHRIDTLDDVASAAGGMESTLSDVARFSQALFDGDALLNASSRADMLDMVEVDASRWKYTGVGLGVMRWDTALGPVFGHTGEDTGYKAFWHYAPERKLTWVLLLNANYGQFAERAAQLRAAVLELLAQ
jgi:D-alanyl-D-alanine carboxypeptidase